MGNTKISLSSFAWQMKAPRLCSCGKVEILGAKAAYGQLVCFRHILNGRRITHCMLLLARDHRPCSHQGARRLEFQSSTLVSGKATPRARQGPVEAPALSGVCAHLGEPTRTGAKDTSSTTPML